MFSFCDGDSAGGNRCALYACQKSKNQKTIQIIVHFWLTNKIDLQNIWTKKHILLSLNQSAKSVTSWPFHEKRFKPNYRTWCHRHLCISSQMHMISAQERGILWKYQYLVQKCWYAAETLLQSLPRVIPSPPLALIYMIFSRRIIKRYYYKDCVTRPTTDREVSSANMPGISTSFSSDSGLSRNSRILSGWRLDLFGFEVSNGFNGTSLPFAINVQEKKMLTKILLLMYRKYNLFKEEVSGFLVVYSVDY